MSARTREQEWSKITEPSAYKSAQHSLKVFTKKLVDAGSKPLSTVHAPLNSPRKSIGLFSFSFFGHFDHACC